MGLMVKGMRLMVFKEAILKKIFGGSNSEDVFFEEAIF